METISRRGAHAQRMGGNIIQLREQYISIFGTAVGRLVGLAVLYTAVL